MKAGAGGSKGRGCIKQPFSVAPFSPLALPGHERGECRASLPSPGHVSFAQGCSRDQAAGSRNRVMLCQKDPNSEAGQVPGSVGRKTPCTVLALHVSWQELQGWRPAVKLVVPGTGAMRLGDANHMNGLQGQGTTCLVMPGALGASGRPVHKGTGNTTSIRSEAPSPRLADRTDLMTVPGTPGRKHPF